MKEAGVKIASLEIENVKRVRAVSFHCAPDGLTLICGDNAQGKTSVLDSIMWVLGGDRFKPSNPVRDGEEKLLARVELSNGIVAERKGKAGALKVTDTTGGKGGMALLNEFVSQFALDLPKFMQASAKDKAKMLLDSYPGLGKRLTDLAEEEKRLYDERLLVGREKERKQKHADDLPYYQEAPEQPLTGSEITQKLQDALSHNAQNREIRSRRDDVMRDIERLKAEIGKVKERLADYERRVEEERARLHELQQCSFDMAKALDAADAEVFELEDEDTTALQEELERIDVINAQVRSNLERIKAQDEATVFGTQYAELSRKIEGIRDSRLELLRNVSFPLPEISVNETLDLCFNGQPWDCMSGMEQLRVATAICANIKPQCGFVLIDQLEKMDRKQLASFSKWAHGRGLQVIGTRVGGAEGDNCIVIEDGAVVAQQSTQPEATGGYENLNF